MVHTLSVVALILLAGSSEASGRALLQQTLQGPYLPDVLAAQTNGWDCQGNTCQRRQMTYDDMWLFYHMFYEPAPPPPPPPSEKELVIKRVYGCHDDDDVMKYYCSMFLSVHTCIPQPDLACHTA